MMAEIDLSAVAARWNLDPPDGLYATAATLAATVALTHLVRYLTRATATPAAGTLPQPTDTAELTTGLADATSLLPRLLRQLAERARAHADQPGLRFTAERPGEYPPDCARGAAHTLAAAAGHIEEAVSPLYPAGLRLAQLTTEPGAATQPGVVPTDSPGWPS